LMLPRLNSATRSGFKLPYFNGRFIVPVLFVAFIYLFLERIQTDLANPTASLQEALFLIYVLVAAVITVLTVVKSYSIIPVMGMLCCAYLLIEIPAVSWQWFFVWMAIGLVIYFSYGYWKSRLAQKA